MLLYRWNPIGTATLCTLIDTNLYKLDDGQTRPKHVAYVTSCRIQLSIVLCKDGLTLIPLTWRMWWAPNNASKWQMGFNLKLSSNFRMVTVLSACIFTGAVQLSGCLVLWFQVPDKQYHDTLYSCLLKEHLELQREYQFLQNRLQRVLAEANRTRLKLEHELAAAVTNVRKLQRLLAEQEGTDGWLSL